MNQPKSYSFEDVNVFVHGMDTKYGELQCACLDMATKIEQLRAEKYNPTVNVQLSNKECVLKYEVTVEYRGKRREEVEAHTPEEAKELGIQCADEEIFSFLSVYSVDVKLIRG